MNLYLQYTIFLIVNSWWLLCNRQNTVQRGYGDRLKKTRSVLAIMKIITVITGFITNFPLHLLMLQKQLAFIHARENLEKHNGFHRSHFKFFYSVVIIKFGIILCLLPTLLGISFSQLVLSYTIQQVNLGIFAAFIYSNFSITSSLLSTTHNHDSVFCTLLLSAIFLLFSTSTYMLFYLSQFIFVLTVVKMKINMHFDSKCLVLSNAILFDLLMAALSITPLANVTKTLHIFLKIHISFDLGLLLCSYRNKKEQQFLNSAAISDAQNQAQISNPNRGLSFSSNTQRGEILGPADPIIATTIST